MFRRGELFLQAVGLLAATKICLPDGKQQCSWGQHAGSQRWPWQPHQIQEEDLTSSKVQLPANKVFVNYKYIICQQKLNSI